MIGSEARASGFNVMLAGGVDLVRDPRNGRNFEYGGEDPLLAGTMVGSEIAGIQSNHIISTIKHYALNDQETGRNDHDALIDPAAARMSDLLAFQIAIERGNPGSVMCSYNQVNGDFACENAWLLNRGAARRDFGFRGYVMSDWGAVHSTEKAALNGLDQESGWPFDDAALFRRAAEGCGAAGRVPQARLDDMARRVLRALYCARARRQSRRRKARRSTMPPTRRSARPMPSRRSCSSRTRAICFRWGRAFAGSSSSAAMRTRACSPAAARRWSIRAAAMPCRACSRPAGRGR